MVLKREMFQMLNPNNNYHILDTDVFDPLHYPLVIKELSVLSKGMLHLPLYSKSEIVVSFLKDHKVDMTWEQTNPEIVTLMTSKDFRIIQLEYLFSSCRSNESFLHDFETYIKDRLLQI